MANTLTGLAPDLFKAADIVARELVGFIPGSLINSGLQAAAQNQTVKSHATRAATVNTSVSPSMTIPEGDNQTVDVKTATLNKVANVQVPWEGEEALFVNSGPGYKSVYGDQLEQAMRAITNQIESELGSALSLGASRAIGTAGTTPFASNFNVLADLGKVLKDNGTPFNGSLSAVMDTAAGAKLRSLAQLQKANEAGSDALLRQGTLLDLQGFMLKESGQVLTHTKGTGAGYLVDLVAGYSIGDTAIHVDTGTGTILAGDVITFAGDTNQYVVASGFAGDGDGDIVLAGPGLQKALANDVAVTIVATHAANIAFHRNAVELAVRPMAKPEGGDAASDTLTIQDPRSGLVYTVDLYKGYKKAMMDITVLYGVKVWKPEFVAKLLG